MYQGRDPEAGWDLRLLAVSLGVCCCGDIQDPNMGPWSVAAQWGLMPTTRAFWEDDLWGELQRLHPGSQKEPPGNRGHRAARDRRKRQGRLGQRYKEVPPKRGAGTATPVRGVWNLSSESTGWVSDAGLEGLPRAVDTPREAEAWLEWTPSCKKS